MYEKERSLDATSTWSVAVVCLLLVSISLLLEHGLHSMGKWLKKLQKPALVGALDKIKTELMLMGFISLLLTVLQESVSKICISREVAATWLPCERKAAKGLDANPKRRLFALEEGSRRELAVAPIDKCSEKGKVAFVSAYGIHQLHYFIFVLAIVHVIFCITIYLLGRSKMRKWKLWEDETKNREIDDYNDPERSRVAKDTSFGRRHLTAWSQPRITLWIVCFFRQFMGSVTRVDYRTLRHGFIMAHFAPGSENRFDFQNYISRTLKDEFKEVVSITPTMWVVALLYFLAQTYGLYSDFWLPFAPLVVLLVVGTKLQMIITRMGLRIQEKGEVIKGKLVVEPGDDLFWFRKPRLIFLVLNLILFQNAFQLAFFIWGWWKFGIESCLHSSDWEIIIKMIMCAVIQILCCYVTLPLYALVSQMGSGIRLTIFNDRVATALRNWHQKAKKRVKESRHSESVTSRATFSNSSTPRDSYHGHYQYDRSLTNSEPGSPKRLGQDGDATPDFDHSDRHDDRDLNVHGGRVVPVTEITADVENRRGTE